MKRERIAMCAGYLLLLAAWPCPAEDATRAESAVPGVRFDPVVRDIEGWTVHVDPALLQGEHQEQGARAVGDGHKRPPWHARHQVAERRHQEEDAQQRGQEQLPHVLDAAFQTGSFAYGPQDHQRRQDKKEQGGACQHDPPFAFADVGGAGQQAVDGTCEGS